MEDEDEVPESCRKAFLLRLFEECLAEIMLKNQGSNQNDCFNSQKRIPLLANNILIYFIIYRSKAPALVSDGQEFTSVSHHSLAK